ncbi:hypothetical protein GQ472_04825 [archaeon]|nr:hypothetical protein [archaeon]
MFRRRKDSKEIEMLRKRGDYLENKVKSLSEILSDVEDEIDSLHVSSDRLHKSGSFELSDDNEKIIVVVDDAEDEKEPDLSQESGKDADKGSGEDIDKGPGKDIDKKPSKNADNGLDSYLNIDMSGRKEEDSILSAGWWPSDGKFRWSGKDSKHGTIKFTLPEAKSYMLDARFFVPKYIAGKHIRIVVNGNEALDFVSSGGLTEEKKVKISAKFLKKGSNSIIFKAGFWCPKTVDSGHKDEGVRSLAFDYIRLDEIKETES